MQISRQLCFGLSVYNYTRFVRTENLNLTGWNESVTHKNAIQCTNTDMNNSDFTTGTTIPKLFLATVLKSYEYEIYMQKILHISSFPNINFLWSHVISYPLSCTAVCKTSLSNHQTKYQTISDIRLLGNFLSTFSIYATILQKKKRVNILLFDTRSLVEIIRLTTKPIYVY